MPFIPLFRYAYTRRFAARKGPERFNTTKEEPRVGTPPRICKTTNKNIKTKLHGFLNSHVMQPACGEESFLSIQNGQTHLLLIITDFSFFFNNLSAIDSGKICFTSVVY